MFKRLTAVILFLTTFSAAQISFAHSCQEFFNGSVGKTHSLRSNGRSIDAPVSSINSPDGLARLFEEIGTIRPGENQNSLGMANLFYRELGQQGVDGVTESLLMNHHHIAREAVLSASLTFARSEYSALRDLKSSFPKPIAKKTFLRWTRLGESFTENVDFMKKLETAINDSISFEFGEQIRADLAIKNVVDGLKGLNDPSLVGRFIELFEKADSLTAQFIVHLIDEQKRVDGRTLTLVLKDTSSSKRDATAKAVVSIFEKTLNHLQEQAYFAYTGDRQNRPQLSDPETTKTVALRFIKRMKFDLDNSDVEYASRILAEHPIPDGNVDEAMVRFLNTGSAISSNRHRWDDLIYAKHELLILTRNARGLSRISIDLRNTTRVLSNKTAYAGYLFKLLEFHSAYDLRKFSALQEIVLVYFRNYPESFNQIKKDWPEIYKKFVEDLNP